MPNVGTLILECLLRLGAVRFLVLTLGSEQGFALRCPWRHKHDKQKTFDANQDDEEELRSHVQRWNSLARRQGRSICNRNVIAASSEVISLDRVVTTTHSNWSSSDDLSTKCARSPFQLKCP